VCLDTSMDIHLRLFRITGMEIKKQLLLCFDFVCRRIMQCISLSAKSLLLSKLFISSLGYSGLRNRLPIAYTMFVSCQSALVLSWPGAPEASYICKTYGTCMFSTLDNACDSLGRSPLLKYCTLEAGIHDIDDSRTVV